MNVKCHVCNWEGEAYQTWQNGWYYPMHLGADKTKPCIASAEPVPKSAQH